MQVLPLLDIMSLATRTCYTSRNNNMLTVLQRHSHDSKIPPSPSMAQHERMIQGYSSPNRAGRATLCLSVFRRPLLRVSLGIISTAFPLSQTVSNPLQVHNDVFFVNCFVGSCRVKAGISSTVVVVVKQTKIKSSERRVFLRGRFIGSFSAGVKQRRATLKRH